VDMSNNEKGISISGFPENTIKFSTLKYLQRNVSDLCARLPVEFKNRDDWEKYRTGFRGKLKELLPVYEPRGQRPDYVILQSDLSSDLVYESTAVNFDSDFYISINIYRPKVCENKLPAVLVCPGYGQPKNDGNIADMCMALAKKDIIAVTLDYPGVGEAADRPDVLTNTNNIAAVANLIGVNDVGLRVMSNLAILRYLKTLKYIEQSRIGITGICQGSIVLWYTAALCEDFAAIAPVCGTTTYEAEVLEYTNRQGGWTGITPFVFNMLKYGDVQHLYGCFAPRPLFVQSNIIDRHWPHSGFEKVRLFVQKVYRLYGASDKQKFLFEHEPHAYAGVFINNLTEWFGNVL